MMIIKVEKEDQRDQCFDLRQQAKIHWQQKKKQLRNSLSMNNLIRKR